MGLGQSDRTPKHPRTCNCAPYEAVPGCRSDGDFRPTHAHHFTRLRTLMHIAQVLSLSREWDVFLFWGRLYYSQCPVTVILTISEKIYYSVHPAGQFYPWLVAVTGPAKITRSISGKLYRLYSCKLSALADCLRFCVSVIQYTAR